MTTFVVRRAAPVLILAFCLGVLVWRTGTPEVSSDTWFHLRMGREFLDGWSLSAPGHLGRYDSAEWVPTQWLSQIAMTGLWDVAGTGGVLWAYAVLKFALVAGVYFLCRRTASPLAASVATLAAWFALLPSLSERPQVLSYLLFLAVVLAWQRQARDGRPRWWLVPLVWVWVPLHGMWIVALATIGVMTVATWLEHRPDVRGTLRLAAVPVLAGLAALATPVGVGAYAAVLNVGSRGDYFLEWGAPELLDGTNLGLLVLLAGVVLAWSRGPAQPWGTVLMLGLAAGFSVYSNRTVPFAVLLLAPMLATAVQQFLPPATRPRRGELATVGAVVAAALVVLAVQLPDRTQQQQPVPAWVDEELSALPSGTPVLASWGSGSYVLWAHPGLELVMHGYGDVFTDEEIERNHTISNAGPGWQDEVEGLDVEYALVEAGGRLDGGLRDDAGWHVVEEDSSYVLLSTSGS